MICLRTRWSWESFGELIEIRLTPTQEGTSLITIASRPRLWITIADYGINWQNVQSIRAAIEAPAS